MGFFTERELFVLVGAAVGIIGYLLVSDLISRRRKKRAEEEAAGNGPSDDDSRS